MPRTYFILDVALEHEISEGAVAEVLAYHFGLLGGVTVYTPLRIAVTANHRIKDPDARLVPLLIAADTGDDAITCGWCDDPITDGNYARIETHLYVEGDELKYHWTYYHWTPETYMNETACLWHHEQ